MEEKTTTALATSQSPFTTGVMIKEMLEVAEQYIKSGIVPWKNTADVVLVFEAARALNIPYATAVMGIVPIQGKPTLTANLQKALLHRAGITFTVDLYYIPVIHVLSEHGVPFILKPEEIYADDSKYHFVGADGARIDGKINVVKVPPPFIPDNYVKSGWVDRVTQVTMYRGDKTISLPYYLHEAFKAGYFTPGKEKDNWLTQTASMMLARDITRNASNIGADALNNMPELQEILDSTSEVVLPKEVIEGFEQAEIVIQQ